MTTYTFAQLGEWAKKSQRRMDVIVKQSTNDVIVQASKTATGVTRGGTNQRGYIPKDVGNLAASLISTLAGSTAITQGGGDFSLVIGSMEAGDKATFVWTAPYARRMHYGYQGTDSAGRTFNQQGWFWVTEAVNDWQSIVRKNTARAKAIIR